MIRKQLIRKVVAKVQKKLLKPKDFYPKWEKFLSMVKEGISKDLKNRFKYNVPTSKISVNKKLSQDEGYLVIRIDGEDFDNDFYYKGSDESIAEDIGSHGSLPEYKEVLDPSSEEFDDLLYDAVKENKIHQALDQFWHTRGEGEYYSKLEKFADKNLEEYKIRSNAEKFIEKIK
jgi:hypothetical protein